jgi:WD40 repeat protein
MRSLFAIHHLCWSPDGRHIAVCGWGGTRTTRILSATTLATERVYRGHAPPVRGLAWAPDGQRMISTDLQAAHLWNTSTGELVSTYSGAHIPHGRLVHFLDFCGNPENKTVSTDEHPWRRSEPRMLNRMQRRAAGTTALVSLRQRQLANEALNSDFSSRIAVKTARMANAKYPKSATGHAECGAERFL